SRHHAASVVCADAAMPGIGGQARELLMTKMKQRLMVAGFDVDLGLHLDTVVNDYVQPVADTCSRNSAVRAIHEQPADLAFSGDVDIITECRHYIREAEVM